jgi:hypothetical protein
MRKTIFAFLFAAALSASAADITDHDGDGLPDLWEAAYGLSTNSAAGINGADGDPDNDGLPNSAEYRAGYLVTGGSVYSNYTWAVSGLAPTNAYSAGTALGDYWHVAASNKVHLGWMFTDHDRADDSWEAAATNGASQYLPDAETVVGGWTAWERCRIASARAEPSAALALSYLGPQDIGTVTISAYSDLSGAPDAVWQVSGANRTHYLTNAVSGRLRRTSVYWLAVPGNGAWTAGDPVGTAVIPAASWSRTDLAIELLHTDGVSLTMALPAPVYAAPELADTRVRIRRSRIDGLSNYQNFPLDSSYSTAHLLSAMDLGSLGLDWNFTNVPMHLVSLDIVTYDVFLGNALVLTNNARVLTFTNRFDSAQAKATAVYPSVGAHVNSARPTLRWSHPEGYPAFAVQIADAASNIVWRSDERPCPPRDADGLSQWQPDSFWAGATTPTGHVVQAAGLYMWRVIALNPKFSLAYTGATEANWTTWSAFRFAVSDPPLAAGFGTITATVRYRGAVSNATMLGSVRLEAFEDAGFSGAAAAQITITNSVALTNAATGVTNAVLRGLAPGAYYVRAYMDANANNVCDPWESLGYADKRGVPGASPNDPLPVTVAANRAAACSLIVEDADTDADWIPDALEYQRNPVAGFLGLTGPHPEWDGRADINVNPYLILSGAFENGGVQ